MLRRVDQPEDAATPVPPQTRIPSQDLSRFVGRLADRVGVPEDQTEAFVDSFVEADLRGVPSHGVMRVPAYLRALSRGIVNPAPTLRTIERRPATALVDADNGLGMVTGQLAMDLAIEIASDSGVGMVSVRNSNHSGMLAIHVLRAARAGMIGYFTSNGPAIMVPWGGADPKLSNGPFAWAFPRGGDANPIVVDMAASATARGKIRQLAATGASMPEGWAVDADGRPTTDARAGMAGAVLPMADHKGYGMAVAHEALAAVLGGGRLAVDAPRDFLADGATVLDSWQIGHMAMAIDPDAFVGRDAFAAELDRLASEIRTTRLAEGVDEVLLPGDPEWQARERNLRDGIPVAGRTLDDLAAFAAEMGVPPLQS
jgi:LDH2 family malate/lactate/ureidoglycolate dehydrogenase